MGDGIPMATTSVRDSGGDEEAVAQVAGLLEVLERVTTAVDAAVERLRRWEGSATETGNEFATRGSEAEEPGGSGVRPGTWSVESLSDDELMWLGRS